MCALTWGGRVVSTCDSALLLWNESIRLANLKKETIFFLKQTDTWCSFLGIYAPFYSLTVFLPSKKAKLFVGGVAAEQGLGAWLCPVVCSGEGRGALCHVLGTALELPRISFSLQKVLAEVINCDWINHTWCFPIKNNLKLSKQNFYPGLHCIVLLTTVVFISTITHRL